MPAIELCEITKEYAQRPALREASLAVEEGAFIVVFGPPACGKSVLVRMLTGLEKPTRGKILLRGADATQQPTAERNIGYVPQSFALYPHFSVHDNIAYPLALLHVPRSEIESAVQRVATQLKISHLLGKSPNQLSGGEKQRVALARGIVKRTDIYILDDPLAGLDFKLREQLFDDLKLMQQSLKATFVYMTSDPLEALALADQIAILDRGQIVETGRVETVYRQPAHIRTMELLGAPPSNRLPGVVRLVDGALQCDAGPFGFTFELSEGAATPAHEERVDIAIRPQDIALAAPPEENLLSCRAEVVLEEDLGAEVVVFLRVGGTSLVTVLPHHLQQGRSEEVVTIGVRPSAIAVFAAETGRRLGQGIHHV